MRDGKTIAQEWLGDSPLIIGRSKSASIRLMDKDISRVHCKIEPSQGAVVVTDSSTNGTFVNGERISSKKVLCGDRIAVGGWVLELKDAIDEGEGQDGKTHLSCQEQTGVFTFDPTKEEVITSEIVLAVKEADGTDYERSFAASKIIIGSGKSSDFSVTDQFASRCHARIESGPSGIYLIDLNSTNGTIFEGKKIELQKLGDVGYFTVGRTKIHFSVRLKKNKVCPIRSHRFGAMTGTTRAMRVVFSVIEKAAPSDAPVCITGESGTGKELVAREIHALSERVNRPFVAVNCAAIPPNMIESQLFGHERGSFTGATERHAGFFEQAMGGSIFLDEIGDMPLELQGRLLRVLETGMVRRLGAKSEIPVNARLICATNKDLKRMSSEGYFRQDLFFRIYVVPISLPALRDRRADIEPLAKQFLEEASPNGARLTLTKAAIKKLCSHEWYGNVRELKNTIIRAVAMRSGDEIDESGIEFISVECVYSNDNNFNENERAYLINNIKDCRGNITLAAKQMGIARTTLQSKLKKLKIKLG